jgi:hypothetical protein
VLAAVPFHMLLLQELDKRLSHRHAPHLHASFPQRRIRSTDGVKVPATTWLPRSLAPYLLTIGSLGSFSFQPLFTHA